ncbi:hypothetical protein BDN67DRAFT_971104 [Paxillus ammoniavirescens]|nr:hypothetical protein BDN67DRAFT_971104 [Paxillus ammoniavirescens]
MSFDTLSILSSIQLNDYTSVAAVTVIGYDYVLTFASEVEYIWKRPWSWVSMLFIVVRYAGFLTAMLNALFGSTFVPGPFITCTMVYLIEIWASFLFLGATELLVILRVYAMYNRSKTVLAILLAFYIVTIILDGVSIAVDSDLKTYMTMSILEVVDVKVCALTCKTCNAVSLLPNYTYISRLVLDTLLCFLAVTQYVRQLLQMHKAVKKWQSNRYMELLVQQSILYFIAINVTELIYHFGVLAGIGQNAQLILRFPYIFDFVLTPRFVLSVRQLCSTGIGAHIDTGFGVDSQRMSRNNNTIVFANGWELPEGDIEMAGVNVESRVEGARG